MTSCGHWIFYRLVLIFLHLPLLQLLSAPRLYRTLSFALTASATILERAFKHATHPCNTHTPVPDYAGLPVRWISRGGNLRTRGKQLTPRIRRTYRGCKKWVSYPVTTKPKQRLGVVRQIWCEMQQQKERRELTSEDTTPVDINRASTEHVSTNPGLTDATSGEHRPGMGGEFVEDFTQQVGGGTLLPVSNPHAITQQAPTIVTQQPPSARGCGRGITVGYVALRRCGVTGVRVVRGFDDDFIVPLCKFGAYARRQCVSCVCRKIPQKVGMIFIGGLYFVFFAFTLVL